MINILKNLAQTISDPNLINIPKGENVDSTNVESIMTIIFQIAGAVALLVIVIAGLRYTFSQGDPSATAKAKNAIIYALVGLVISLLGFSIVRFVVRGVS